MKNINKEKWLAFSDNYFKNAGVYSPQWISKTLLYGPYIPEEIIAKAEKIFSKQKLDLNNEKVIISYGNLDFAEGIIITDSNIYYNLSKAGGIPKNKGSIPIAEVDKIEIRYNKLLMGTYMFINGKKIGCLANYRKTDKEIELLKEYFVRLNENNLDLANKYEINTHNRFDKEINSYKKRSNNDSKTRKKVMAYFALAVLVFFLGVVLIDTGESGNIASQQASVNKDISEIEQHRELVLGFYYEVDKYASVCDEAMEYVDKAINGSSLYKVYDSADKMKKVIKQNIKEIEDVKVPKQLPKALKKELDDFKESLTSSYSFYSFSLTHLKKYVNNNDYEQLTKLKEKRKISQDYLVDAMIHLANALEQVGMTLGDVGYK